MKYEKIKEKLTTTGYLHQDYKDKILEFIDKLQEELKITENNCDKIINLAKDLKLKNDYYKLLLDRNNISYLK